MGCEFVAQFQSDGFLDDGEKPLLELLTRIADELDPLLPISVQNIVAPAAKPWAGCAGGYQLVAWD